MPLHNNEKSKNSQYREGVFPFWKNSGETLAVMLRRFREEHNFSADDKLTYAGRLDPMAEGIVPILSGIARFHKDHLLNASKTYEVVILLGLSTDTGDMLGLLTNNTLEEHRFERIKDELIKNTIEQLRSLTELVYPHYSSRPVDGKPLFVHARAGNEVKLPVKKITIHSLEMIGIKEVALKELLANAMEVISKVYGDFRQEAILEQWKKIQEQDGEIDVQIVSIRTTVSSGTYMRSLAEKMGELLGVPALAYSIVRTAVEEK